MIPGSTVRLSLLSKKRAAFAALLTKHLPITAALSLSQQRCQR